MTLESKLKLMISPPPAADGGGVIGWTVVVPPSVTAVLVVLAALKLVSIEVDDGRGTAPVPMSGMSVDGRE